MSYRCIDPFATADGAVYSGGVAVDDDHPILATHRSHFARVTETPTGGETATAAPGEVRHVAAKKAPAKKVAPPPAEAKPQEPTEPSKGDSNA